MLHVLWESGNTLLDTHMEFFFWGGGGCFMAKMFLSPVTRAGASAEFTLGNLKDTTLIRSQI